MNSTQTFAATVASIVSGLQSAVGGSNREIHLIASSGTGALESAVQNLASPGDSVLIAVNGFFGQRLVTMCERYRLEVRVCEVPLGREFDFDNIAAAVAEPPCPSFAACVHCESETGTVNDVERFAEAVRPALVVVDAISSAGAVRLDADRWNVDVVVGSAGKALLGPPGLSFVCLSDRAVAASEAIDSGFYFSWPEAVRGRRYSGLASWTPAISLLREFEAALSSVAQTDGLDRSIAGHRALGRLVRRGLQAVGLRLLTPDDDESSVLTAFSLPQGITADAVIPLLRERWGVELAPGVNDDTIMRIGHAGYIDALDLVGAVLALAETLETLGAPMAIDAAATALASELSAYARTSGLAESAR